MRTRLRMLLLACVSMLSLALASSALAAFTPTLAVGHQPPTVGAAGTTVIRVAVPRDDDALFRAVIYVPRGYTATLNQAPGTQLGTVAAQVQVREPIAGAVLPLTGTITADNPANHTTAQCAPGLHTAVWLLTLQASGQTLTVPMYVDATSGQTAQLASYTITVCLPSPHIPPSAGGATFGAKLILAQLTTRGVFTAPTTRGTYRWRMVTTPWPNGPGLPNAAGTVEAQARVMLPASVTLTTSSRRRVLTIRGRVVEFDTGVNRQTVRIRVGRRTYSVRTTAGGGFRLSLRFRRPGRTTVSVTAAIPARTIRCSDPSPFRLTCVGETLQFFTVSRSVRARIR